jgi:hypothetical protein
VLLLTFRKQTLTNQDKNQNQNQNKGMNLNLLLKESHLKLTQAESLKESR